MTTVREIIAAAHRKIAVLAHDENMTATMGETGLFAYNVMLHGFKAHGADVSHTDQALTDDFALGDQFKEGAIYLLASRLSPDYMIPAAFDVDGFWRMIQAAYATIPTLTVPAALLNPPSRNDREGVTPVD